MRSPAASATRRRRRHRASDRLRRPRGERWRSTRARRLRRRREPASDKRYYRIGEVSRITGVKPYVLRYWESEFRWMAPPEVALEAAAVPQARHRHDPADQEAALRPALHDRRRAQEAARDGRRARPRRRGAAPSRPTTARAIRKIRDELERDPRDALSTLRIRREAGPPTGPTASARAAARRSRRFRWHAPC